MPITCRTAFQVDGRFETAQALLKDVNYLPGIEQLNVSWVKFKAMDKRNKHEVNRLMDILEELNKALNEWKFRLCNIPPITVDYNIWMMGRDKERVALLLCMIV
jgi:hypothetical protein